MEEASLFIFFNDTMICLKNQFDPQICLKIGAAYFSPEGTY